MKKVLALLLALVMVLSLAATAFATEPSTEPTSEPPAETLPAGSDSSSSDTDDSGVIKIENPNPNHTYKAYQIFTGDYDSTTEELTNYAFGTGINSTALITALQGDATVGTYFTDDATAADVAVGLSELEKAGDSELLAAAFEIIAANLVQHYTTGRTAADGNHYIPAKRDDGSQSGYLQAGYYLIDETNSENSPIMVKVVRGTTPMMQKGDEISVSTNLMDTDFDQANADSPPDGSPATPNLQSKWQDVADYNIGDIFTVRSYVANLPDDYSDFDYYNILVTAELPKGTTAMPESYFMAFLYFSDGTMGTYSIGDVEKVDEAETPPVFLYELETEVVGTDEAGADITKTTIKVFPNREYTPTADAQSRGEDGKPGSVYGGNLKALSNEFAKEIEGISFAFSVRLNKNAEIGLPGNAIKSQVQFTKDSTGAVSTTPWDEAIVFTYELDVTKVDAIDNDLQLEGAQFILYRINPDTAQYEQLRFKENGEREWAEDDGESTKLTEHGHWYYEDGILTTDVNGELKFVGLDDGTYHLREVIAPAGYELPAKSYLVNIEATHGEADFVYQGDPATALTGLKMTVTDNNLTDDTETPDIDERVSEAEGDLDAGSVSTTVENEYLSELPETGGVGTTLFYIIGGLMVVCAAVVLVTKRRMSV